MKTWLRVVQYKYCDDHASSIKVEVGKWRHDLVFKSCKTSLQMFKHINKCL